MMILTRHPANPILFVAVVVAVAPLSAQRALPDSAFLGCYRVEYKNWGRSRIIGHPIGEVHAPAIIVLTTQQPAQDFGFAPKDALGAKVLAQPRDSQFYSAYWTLVTRDSAAIVVPGLYGLSYRVQLQRDSLVGVAQTYTDVIGAKQASSPVIAIRSKCPRGA